MLKRPFAYNTGASISGTIQVGSLAVGTPTSGFTNSPRFWSGPDEDLGYVIAYPVSGGTHPTPIFGVTAYLGFKGTKNMINPFSESTFVKLTNKSFKQSFTNGNDASTWLTTNGYWNSWVSITPTITPTTTTTITPTITPTISVTPSITPSITPTITSSVTPTISITPTLTPTLTPTKTVTPSITPTISITPTKTVTPTITPTPNIVSNNLVLYYDPSNSSSYPGTGTTVNDLSGNGLNGTMSNITFTSPYFTYNGSTSQVSRADNALLEPGTGDWTIEVWLRYNVSTGKTQTFVSKTNNGGAASNWSYGLRTNSAGATYFEVGNGTTSITSPSFNVLANTWYQVVGVWTNVVSNSIELYINGTSQGSNGHSFASILNSTNPLYLGNYNGNEFLQQFDGIMGVVRMYNNALSSAQVTQNYNYTYLKYISPTPTPTPTQTQTPSITPTISITPTKTLTPTPTNTPNLQGFSYSNFASTTGLVGVGNTSVSSNIYFLTTTAGGQVGNVYRTTAIQYNRNFSTQWSTFIGGGTGADGYCVQWTTTNNTNGPTGGGVGLITNAINAITFLTYTNNNYTWYSNNVSQGATSVSSGLWRQTLYFWGDYNHSAQTFALYYNTTNSKPGSPNKTFTSFSFDTGSYYMGFGAGTGGSTDNHELLSWSLTFT